MTRLPHLNARAMRRSALWVSLIGALAWLPCRVASAQGAGRLVEGFPLAAIGSPSLEPGWWHTVTDALDAMRGLRGRRIPALVARQVDLRAALAPANPLMHWRDLPPLAQPPPRPLELRFGPLQGGPLRTEPVTASLLDLRGESGDLLGVRVTWPWRVP